MNMFIKVFLIFIFTVGALKAQEDQTDKKIAAFKNSIEAEEIGNYSKALNYLLEIKDGLKNDYITNLRIGWLYYLNKDYEKSIEYYNRAVRLSDNSIESLLGLTYPYSGEGNWKKVEEIYYTILGHDPNHYTANLRLGQMFMGNEDYLNARSHLEKIEKLYPSDYEINLYLGWTYLNLGNKNDAKKRFLTALVNNPGDQSAIEGLNNAK